MDRLSDLPKHILDNILGGLPDEDAARTSVLSKAWNDTWSTRPILRFSQQKYVYGVGKDRFHPNEIMPAEDLKRERKNFVDHVQKTLTRFHDQCLAIREFRLHMKYSDSQSIYPLIDHWMRLLVESGNIQAIDLMLLHDRVPNDHYCLPASVLHAKSLIKLSLRYLKLDHALNNPIQFSSLQELSLICVTLRDDQTIQNVISSCPLIEYLAVIFCRLEDQNDLGLKSVRIHGLRKLKTIVALQVQEIDIDVPNLEYLCYSPASGTAPFKTNLDNCRNLRGLKLSILRSIIINDQWLHDLFLKFPLLEKLELPGCNFSEKIRVSSTHLKVLELTDYFHSNLKEINFDAPNLCSFRYNASLEIPTLSFIKSSSQLQIDLSIFFRFFWDLKKLREFLQNFEHRNILASLSMEIHWRANELNSDALSNVSVPPPSIKHLNLRIDEKIHTTDLLQLVTGLLCSCRPSVISVRRNSTSDSLIEVLCNVLFSGKDAETCSCSLRGIRCWWHDLKGVQVIRTYEDVYEKVAIQLEY